MAGSVGRLSDFLDLSAALTGFSRAELQGTGMAASYFGEVSRIVGRIITGELLAAWRVSRRGGRAGAARAAALRRGVLDDPKLGPVARAVITLWYLGKWTQLPPFWRTMYRADPLDADHVVSPAAYRASLVWIAAGSHPMGARQPGYGTWSLPPAGAAPAAARGRPRRARRVR